LKRIGADSRANTEAEHYNPLIFNPQATEWKIVVWPAGIPGFIAA